MVFKTNEAGLVEETNAASSPWWKWVERRLAYEVDALHEAMGRVIAHERRAFRDEIGLLRRELAVLKEEVAVERKLAALKSGIPSIPDIEKRIAAEQVAAKREMASLRRELAKAKCTIGTLRADVSQAQYCVDQLEKKPPSPDAQTLEIMRECAKQWVEAHKPEPEQPTFVAGHYVPEGRVNGTAKN